MLLSTITAAMLLPFLGAFADGTTTYTSAQTKTITVLRVVATTTSTYHSNSTIPYPSGTGAVGIGGIPTTTAKGSKSPTQSVLAATSPVINGASSMNGVAAGAAGIVGMVIAAML